MTAPPIILSTSAPAKRSYYRRDFLTCMAAPKRQVASFSYRARWIEPALLDAPGSIAGREALLVFGEPSDSVGGEFAFVAFRHARIRGFRPSELVRNKALYDGDTHIAVDFSLERFVHVPPAAVHELIAEWTAVLGDLAIRPRPAGHETDGQTRFMFAGPSLREGEAVNDNTSWRALAEELAAYDSLRGSYFFRVAAVMEGARERTPDLHARRLQYRLDTKREYRLLLDAYSEKTVPPAADALETVATSDRLVVENPSTQTLGAGESVAIDLTAGAVQSSTATTLVIRGRGAVTDQAPRIELAMRIVPRPLLTAAIIALIALGTALSGLSKTDLGVSSWAVVVLVKAVGVGCVVAGLFWASRRAPGVSK